MCMHVVKQKVSNMGGESDIIVAVMGDVHEGLVDVEDDDASDDPDLESFIY